MNNVSNTAFRQSTQSPSPCVCLGDECDTILPYYDQRLQHLQHAILIFEQQTEIRHRGQQSDGNVHGTSASFPASTCQIPSTWWPRYGFETSWLPFLVCTPERLSEITCCLQMRITGSRAINNSV